jgi:peroxiredoxin
MAIKTGLPLHHLELPVVGGEKTDISKPPPGGFLVLVFYRGLHCRRCNPYLNVYQSVLPRFHDIGAEVIAVSADDKARAEQSVKEWGLTDLKVAYDFPLDAAEDWGLYVTEGEGHQPPLFSEPATFIVWPDGKLDHALINTAQRLRPDPEVILEHIHDRMKELAEKAG